MLGLSVLVREQSNQHVADTSRVDLVDELVLNSRDQIDNLEVMGQEKQLDQFLQVLGHVNTR